MRPVVPATLLEIWMKQNRPDTGLVFVNKLRKPRADARQTGGNPLCQIAGWCSMRMIMWYTVFEQSDLDEVKRRRHAPH